MLQYKICVLETFIHEKYKQKITITDSMLNNPCINPEETFDLMRRNLTCPSKQILAKLIKQKKKVQSFKILLFGN